MQRRMHEVLQQFTQVITKHNPMNLPLDLLSDELEYDVEALSILGRFSETALHIPNDEKEVSHIAESIVKQTFDFWFNPGNIDSYQFDELSQELLTLYRENLRH